MAPIPITIVTGFLGSGKTTLLLNLVPQLRANNPEYRLALLKNEFGDVAVDSQLAESSALSGVREMLNGCICCNMVGSLSSALQELSEVTGQQPPDRIVIETSGSAFPATLAMEVNRVNRESGGKYILDGVVSVIDVENWKGYEDTSYTARVQAKYTDLIVFNKWENCDERRFDDCLDRVGDLEVEIPWVKSDKGRVPVDVIFGVDSRLAKTLLEGDDSDKATNGVNGNATNGHADHDHADHDHKSDHQAEVEVLSVTMTAKDGRIGVVNGPKLMLLLNAARKEEVYRMKAVLTAWPSSVRSSDNEEESPAPNNDGPTRFILNWAFGRWTFTPLANDGSEHPSTSTIPLRMTVITARYESAKWKSKLEGGDFMGLEGEGGGFREVEGDGGELVIKKIQ